MDYPLTIFYALVGFFGYKLISTYVKNQIRIRHQKRKQSKTIGIVGAEYRKLIK